MELIELINNLKEMRSKGFLDCNIEAILLKLNRIENDKKVEVPQYVANWYEENRKDFEFAVFNYLYTLDTQEETSFKKWLIDSKTKPFQTLVNMHLFGYKVKEETKYTVKVKNVQNGTEYLKYDRVIEKWYFGIEKGSVASRLYHTKEELEKGYFGWVFSCEGMEVIEVEKG